MVWIEGRIQDRLRTKFWVFALNSGSKGLQDPSRFEPTVYQPTFGTAYIRKAKTI